MRRALSAKCRARGVQYSTQAKVRLAAWRWRSWGASAPGGATSAGVDATGTGTRALAQAIAAHSPTLSRIGVDLLQKRRRRGGAAFDALGAATPAELAAPGVTPDADVGAPGAGVRAPGADGWGSDGATYCGWSGIKAGMPGGRVRSAVVFGALAVVGGVGASSPWAEAVAPAPMRLAVRRRRRR